MKRLLIGAYLKIIFISTLNNCLYAQKESPNINKPSLDTSVLKSWPMIGFGEISNDGRYVKYITYTSSRNDCHVFFQATSGDWKVVIPRVKKYSLISNDSKIGVFIKGEDSLGLLKLGTSFVEYIPFVEAFRVLRHANREWLAYESKTQIGKLVLRDLGSGEEHIYLGVKSYTVSEDKKVLILQVDTTTDLGKEQLLRWVEPINGKDIPLWLGKGVRDITIDRNDSQVCFTVEKGQASEKQFSIGYFRLGTKKAEILTDNSLTLIDSNLELGNTLGFTKDGKNLFVNLHVKAAQRTIHHGVSLDVWNWKDDKLQSQQLLEKMGEKTYLALFNLENKKITRIQFDNELLFGSVSSASGYLLMCRMVGDAPYNERNWNPAYQNVTLCLVSVCDGGRALVRSVKRDLPFAYLSPGDNFLVYYDSELHDYFSYEISTGVTRNITRGINTSWTKYQNDHPLSDHTGYPIEGWLKDDAGVLLHDQFDIWRIDLKGKKPPINITNGYGRKYNILFHILFNNLRNNTGQISGDEEVMFSAFNQDTKENGFFSKVLNKSGNPLPLLTMNNCLYFVEEGGLMGEMPKKARDSNVYLIRRENAHEFPTYFCTADFKFLKPLSDLHPEQNYNWLRSELIVWKTPQGTVLRGVLYKPEDFDSRKKYPIIFDIYEKRSDDLHSYKLPQVAGDRINIPWFVSRGYLVFTPDIRYTIGEPAQSALYSVLSAADYVEKLPGINIKGMGIQGHSWGGFEVNYIITHSNIFSAAMSASSCSDNVSDYGSLMPANGGSKQYFYELYQYRIGATLWERPDLYIKSSPVFRANKITTPLLMMNNKDDGVVPFSQGIELFTALRRLGKKVWLLQYDGEVHSLYDTHVAMDYTIRMTQFFDHYLKGEPAPIWMTKGIKASEKGLKDGLDLDCSGETP